LTVSNPKTTNAFKKELNMKLRNINMWPLAAVAMLFSSGSIATAVAQAPVAATRGWGKSGPLTIKMAGNDAAAKIRAAAEAVRDAKDSKEKEDAQKKLADVLSKCYDEDMANREKELTQVEERLKKLRDLLERRRAKKQEVVELQTKVALNEAEGLGFYDGERGPKGPLNIAGTVRSTYVGPGPDMLFEVPQGAPPVAPAAAPGMAPGPGIPR
jgi:hypothetical protein